MLIIKRKTSKIPEYSVTLFIKKYHFVLIKWQGKVTKINVGENIIYNIFYALKTLKDFSTFLLITF